MYDQRRRRWLQPHRAILSLYCLANVCLASAATTRTSMTAPASSRRPSGSPPAKKRSRAAAHPKRAAADQSSRPPSRRPQGRSSEQEYFEDSADDPRRSGRSKGGKVAVKRLGGSDIGRRGGSKVSPASVKYIIEDEEVEGLPEEAEEEVDFDDEDADEYEPLRRPKVAKQRQINGRAARRPVSRATSKALAYSPSYPVREPLQQKMMRNLYVLSEKASGITAKGKKVTRELKEYLSGDWESMLLKATRPDDQRPSPEYIGTILDATATFHRGEDLLSSNNPYRVTLRKIWAKMAEKDWRTVSKSLYIFHVLLRECEPDDVRIYQKVYGKLSRELCRKTKCRYFDPERIDDVGEAEDVQAERRGFIRRYRKYVLSRCKAFTSKFEELKAVGERDIVLNDLTPLLSKADKLISLGLDCAATTEEESDTTIMCVELVARDLYDLFRLWQQALQLVALEQDAVGGQEALDRELNRLRRSYDEKYPLVATFLTEVKGLLSMYGIKLKTKLPKPLNWDALRGTERVLIERASDGATVGENEAQVSR